MSTHPEQDLSPSVATDTPSTDTPVVTEPAEYREHPLAEIIKFAIIAIIIVVPIRLFVAQPFIVSGASMDNTFHNGQYLIVDQVSYYFDDPARGDVIIFRPPNRPDDFFIKRIIGIPGDTVTIEENQIIITNETYPKGYVLDEPYIREPMSTNTPRQPWILGPDQYFVMGDNRNQSQDSRVFGMLSKSAIKGRAWVRLFPPNTAEFSPGEVTITGTSRE